MSAKREGGPVTATVVERLRLHRLEVPLASPYKLAFGPVTKFDTILVEAQDSDGRIGLGEATLLTGYTDETVDGAWDLMQRVAAGFPGLEGVGFDHCECHVASQCRTPRWAIGRKP